MNVDYEAYVRGAWVHVARCDGSYRGYPRGTVLVQQVIGQWVDFPSWLAAYNFTLQRQEEIRQVEEEIACLGGFMNALIERIPKKDRNPSIIAAFRRTMIRLQSIRAELQKGMK
jgi:hypothetical protein